MHQRERLQKAAKINAGEASITGTAGNYLYEADEAISDSDRDKIHKYLTEQKTSLEAANTDAAGTKRTSDIATLTTALTKIS